MVVRQTKLLFWSDEAIECCTPERQRALAMDCDFLGPNVPLSNNSSPLERHIRSFATENGYVTMESITLGHHRLGITEGVYVKAYTIMNLL